MSCDYYTESSIVIDYISFESKICKIVKTTKIERNFLHANYKSDNEKYDKKIEEIENYSTIKIIYSERTWKKDTYQEKYESWLKKKFPEIKSFIKIYKKRSSKRV
jgi:hypothetical protein